MMSNMSYCRFQNTARDLNECVEIGWGEDLSPEEERAKQRIIRLAREIVSAEGMSDANNQRPNNTIQRRS